MIGRAESTHTQGRSTVGFQIPLNQIAPGTYKCMNYNYVASCDPQLG